MSLLSRACFLISSFLVSLSGVEVTNKVAPKIDTAKIRALNFISLVFCGVCFVVISEANL